jgi:hypothetical protein
MITRGENRSKSRVVGTPVVLEYPRLTAFNGCSEVTPESVQVPE